MKNLIVGLLIAGVLMLASFALAYAVETVSTGSNAEVQA